VEALRVGLIGYGYWGPNLARNFSASKACRLVRVADTSEPRLALARSTFPWIETTRDAAEITRAADLDVVVIATPVGLHHRLAKDALETGKHAWVEKPLTASVAEATELVALARSMNRTLFVDHTFLYTAAVRKMKELIDSGELGGLYYYDSIRINLGLFQNDVNVVWDLAAHDFSIMDYLLGPTALAVSAQGRAHVREGQEDVAYISVFYADNLIAHFHVNWLSPVKVRQTIVGGSKKMLLWDDMSPDEKIKVYSRGVEIRSTEDRNRILAEYRMGDMYCPNLPGVEALKLGIDHFVDCIASGSAPVSDGAAGLRIVRMLEAVDASLRQGGAVVDL
jgi:predicted dehydrogenase